MSRTRPRSHSMQRAPMVRTSHSIRRDVEALASREPAFARVVEQHGVPEPRTSNRGAVTLLRTIVGQQVSVAAARAMWEKRHGPAVTGSRLGDALLLDHPR